MPLGTLLLAATLATRAFIANRHIKSRLLVSSLAFALYAVMAYALVGHAGEPVALVVPLILIFGFSTGAVALAVNPWRNQGLPERFPTIVQDAMVIGLFGVGAIVVLQEKVFATTAVGAVVLGFALQDTLGNLFAGLAIQIEKPFRVGHWVRIAGTDGQVTAITWRATKIRTKQGNLVIVPNSALSKDTITNFSEPTLETCVELDVGASYDAVPNTVKQVILDALADAPAVLTMPAPEVWLWEFGASAVVYRIRAWTTDFANDARLRERIRTAVYYAFRRSNIVIPYPVQVEIRRNELPPPEPDRGAIAAVLQRVRIFSPLDAGALAHLASETTRYLFAAGETIVRQGTQGSSMFIIESGEAVVVRDPGAQEVARVAPGGFFGEMSLLTGEPRTATVRTLADSWVMEITADAFRSVVLAHPVALEQVSAATAQRLAELAQLAAAQPTAAPHQARTLLARVRRFLRLEPD